jgi:hypothetical protein
LEKSDDVAHIFYRQRRYDCGVCSRVNCNVKIGKRLFPRRACHAHPCFDGTGGRYAKAIIYKAIIYKAIIYKAIIYKAIIYKADLVGFDPYQLLSLAVSQAIPFAVRAHAEDYVGSEPILRGVTEDLALLLFNYVAGRVNHSDNGNAQPAPWQIPRADESASIRDAGLIYICVLRNRIHCGL